IQFGNDRLSVCPTAGTFPLSYPVGSFPTGVGFDGQGNSYVADGSLSHVQVFRPSGTLIKTWTGTGASQMNLPNALAVTADGQVYVADSNHNRIELFAESDQSPPETTIDSGPSGSTTDTSPS